MGNKIKTSSNVFKEIEEKDLSRRQFLKIAGIFTISVSGAGLISCGNTSNRATGNNLASRGYILVDSKKCQGCLTCMISCSLVHEGTANLSLARLQITQNPYMAWPDDITITQCRQCQEPTCVESCPADALFIDTENGNVRRVDKELCLGCGLCVTGCGIEPKNPVLVQDTDNTELEKSQKCDLCLNAPYHWDSTASGLEGRQACVKTCPLGAISFTSTMPVQNGDSGYDVNLRQENWEELGFSIED